MHMYDRTDLLHQINTGSPLASFTIQCTTMVNKVADISNVNSNLIYPYDEVLITPNNYFSTYHCSNA